MNGQAIIFPAGRYNPAGLTKVYYTFVENIAAFPTLAKPETATTFASLVEYVQAIVMQTGMQFHELYCTLEEGEIKSNLVGARDGKGYENMLEISFPGNESEFLGFKAAAANRGLVFLIKEKNSKIRVLGSLEDPAFMESDDSTSGKKIADSRKSTLTFKASGSTPAPVYAVTAGIASLLVPAGANGFSPIISVGANKSVVLPATTLTINGVFSYADGLNVVCEKVSGPAGTLGAITTDAVAGTFTQNLSALVEGVYVLRYKLVDPDDSSVKAVDDVTVTVA